MVAMKKVASTDQTIKWLKDYVVKPNSKNNFTPERIMKLCNRMEEVEENDAIARQRVMLSGKPVSEMTTKELRYMTNRIAGYLRYGMGIGYENLVVGLLYKGLEKTLTKRELVLLRELYLYDESKKRKQLDVVITDSRIKVLEDWSQIQIAYEIRKNDDYEDLLPTYDGEFFYFIMQGYRISKPDVRRLLLNGAQPVATHVIRHEGIISFNEMIEQSKKLLDPSPSKFMVA